MYDEIWLVHKPTHFDESQFRVKCKHRICWHIQDCRPVTIAAHAAEMSATILKEM